MAENVTLRGGPLDGQRVENDGSDLIVEPVPGKSKGGYQLYATYKRSAENPAEFYYSDDPS